MITCDDLTVSYGATTAVDAVSFDVGAGEIFGLLGPNGAGKTTVIRALTTILGRDAGSVTIDGVDLDDAAAVRSRIGVLPESTGYPGASHAVDYLTFHGRLFGTPKAAAHERAEEVLAQLGLGDHMRQPIRTFSRGMRQRLGIARALVNRPRVLFLDEPTLGLDPAGKDEILNHLRTEVSGSGAAVVLCSHLLDEVERVCHRVGIMHRARIVASGSVADVVAQTEVAGGARIDVDPVDVDRVMSVVATRADMQATPRADTVGVIDVDFNPAGPTITDLAGLLAGNDVAFSRLEARGARLSDAFLELTSDHVEVAA